ncbi:hypothetical protein BH23GEM6_BH23GEM6_06630 [soil metagenome]
MPDFRASHARAEADDEGDGSGARTPPIMPPRLRRSTPKEASDDRGTVRMLVRDLPNFVKLLGRLATDSRVSRVDKAIVVATLGYLIMPMDLIPDFIPFFGQLDDLFLLALALDRLLNNAGIDVILDHWDGQIATIEMTISALDRVGGLLPEQIRDLLRARIG